MTQTSIWKGTQCPIEGLDMIGAIIGWILMFNLVGSY
jgi:hypothetical protein